MVKSSLWINGPSRSGKTTRLVQEWQRWVQAKLTQSTHSGNLSDTLQPATAAVLIWTPNSEQRRHLSDKLANAVRGSYPVICKTPIGFLGDEVVLFWPLLVKSLAIKAQFPLRLRPETEQELATKLWRSQVTPEIWQGLGGENRFVRRLLDLWQLAGASCTLLESISEILRTGIDNVIIDPELAAELLQQWRGWCLSRGLLTYGLIYELYWRYLLPDEYYRQQLSRRYEAIFADDVDDYPAIAREIGEFLLDQGKWGVFTYNYYGQIRLGLNADPEYVAGLANRCQILELEKIPGESLGYEYETGIIEVIQHPLTAQNLDNLPPIIQSVQTTSRAQLLQKVAAVIIAGIKAGQVKPQEIAIIAPGLDEIARYNLKAILASHKIELEPLNEQRPLSSSPLVRALLTLLALLYPGLGRLVAPEAIAEMLVILSHNQIDPVRAGIISDYCYQVDLEEPYLLPTDKFPRWDRLGYQATAAYEAIADWIKQYKKKEISPVLSLSQAIQRFFSDRAKLNYEKLAVLRELMETSQHYWEVNRRLRENEPTWQGTTDTIRDFILLLRRGTITANPYPVRMVEPQKGKVTLATIFQYRSQRTVHRWHFWLDAGSILWHKGGAAMLYGAPLFWQSWTGRPWTAEDELVTDAERLNRIIKDLLSRVTEKIYLCHSELGLDGREQLGPLLSLIYSSREA